ncbi:MAG: hypothetical protein ACXVBN_03840 [Flavisolibacter sp.]
MLSFNELRLGNRVLVNKNIEQISMITPVAVFTIDPEKGNTQIAAEHHPEEIYPVLLTDDILKQCGFSFHDYFNFWQLIITGAQSDMDVNSGYDVIDFMRRPIIKKLASLHQLQNVYFMLKGKELKLQILTVANRN